MKKKGYSSGNKEDKKGNYANEPSAGTYQPAKEGYQNVLTAASQLPRKEIKSLVKELEKMLESPKKTTTKGFQQFLLEGPVMSDQQYEKFLEARKHFNQWRTN